MRTLEEHNASVCANRNDDPPDEDYPEEGALEMSEANVGRVGRKEQQMTDWYREINDGTGVERVNTPEMKNRWKMSTKVQDTEVSTVFLALDHNWDGGTPILYETMIFGGPLDQSYQRRYFTRAEAIIGHAEAIEAAKEAICQN